MPFWWTAKSQPKRLIDEFPFPLMWGEKRRQWNILLETADRLHYEVLKRAVQLGRINPWEAQRIKQIIEGTHLAEINGRRCSWADLVQAVETVRELAKREGVDSDLDRMKLQHQ